MVASIITRPQLPTAQQSLDHHWSVLLRRLLLNCVGSVYLHS